MASKILFMGVWLGRIETRTRPTHSPRKKLHRLVLNKENFNPSIRLANRERRRPQSTKEHCDACICAGKMTRTAWKLKIEIPPVWPATAIGLSLRIDK